MRYDRLRSIGFPTKWLRAAAIALSPFVLALSGCNQKEAVEKLVEDASESDTDSSTETDDDFKLIILIPKSSDSASLRLDDSGSQGTVSVYSRDPLPEDAPDGTEENPWVPESEDSSVPVEDVNDAISSAEIPVPQDGKERTVVFECNGLSAVSQVPADGLAGKEGQEMAGSGNLARVFKVLTPTRFDPDYVESLVGGLTEEQFDDNLESLSNTLSTMLEDLKAVPRPVWQMRLKEGFIPPDEVDFGGSGNGDVDPATLFAMVRSAQQEWVFQEAPGAVPDNVRERLADPSQALESIGVPAGLPDEVKSAVYATALMISSRNAVAREVADSGEANGRINLDPFKDKGRDLNDSFIAIAAAFSAIGSNGDAAGASAAAGDFFRDMREKIGDGVRIDAVAVEESIPPNRRPSGGFAGFLEGIKEDFPAGRPIRPGPDFRCMAMGICDDENTSGGGGGGIADTGGDGGGGAFPPPPTCLALYDDDYYGSIDGQPGVTGCPPPPPGPGEGDGGDGDASTGGGDSSGDTGEGDDDMYYCMAIGCPPDDGDDSNGGDSNGDDSNGGDTGDSTGGFMPPPPPPEGGGDESGDPTGGFDPPPPPPYGGGDGDGEYPPPPPPMI